MRNEIDQQAVVGHVVLQIGMRPVRAPENAIREFLHDFSREGHNVAIGVLLAIESART